MKKVFHAISRALEEKKDVVLVTVVAGTGSTPRGAGARMWIASDGSCHGTIGGGSIEYRVCQKAWKLLRDRESTSAGYNLGVSGAKEIGMVCGGRVVVYFQFIAHEDVGSRMLVERIAEQCDKEEDAWLLMDISGEQVWEMGLYTRSGGLKGMQLVQAEQLLTRRPVCMEIEGKTYYAEPIVKAGTVYVFGGGHVARELVPLLTRLDFRCVVLDDRAEFANRGRFPEAKETLISDFQDISEKVTITEQDYVVIMTRGHEHDYRIQSQVLGMHPYYIGVMGSRNKIAFVTERLLKDGYTKEEIESCHMPIGTAILAETPAEIAVSIAGELIRMRAEKKN